MAMMIGNVSPSFIMMAMHDIGKMRRATLLCYTPFAVISVVLAVAERCGRRLRRTFRSADFTAAYALEAHRCRKCHP